jgi:hypothetical protein
MLATAFGEGLKELERVKLKVDFNFSESICLRLPAVNSGTPGRLGVEGCVGRRPTHGMA